MVTRPVTRPPVRPVTARFTDIRIGPPVIVDTDFGPPVGFTTPGAPGPFTLTNGSRRIGTILEDLNLELDSGNVGRPYRIDFEVTAATEGASLKVDWCDVNPASEFTNVTPGHYFHESAGRFGGYSATYKFADFVASLGTVTFTNIVIREIL